MLFTNADSVDVGESREPSIGSHSTVQALLSRDFHLGILQGFDLTPKMLEDFRRTLQTQEIDGVEFRQADVLQLDTLPSSWNNFDLIVSAAMMEYVPHQSLVDALSGLRSRLNEAGSILLFITRRNWLTRPLIGRWWAANLYEAAELQESFCLAGASNSAGSHSPTNTSLWGHVIEAK